MEKLRIGFVGAGSMGQCAHLRNYIDRPDCQIVAIAELRTELAHLVARRYGIPGVYRDHDEMLSHERLDAIVAIQPFQMHGRLVPDLLRARLPILTEKPLARSVQVGDQLLAAASAADTRLYIAYHKRSDPAVIHAIRTIERWRQNGRMGAMKLVRITMPPGDWAAAGFCHLLKTPEPFPPLAMDDPPSQMQDSTVKRLDAFVNYYIHQVNLMRHLMGCRYRVDYADPTRVLMVAQGENGVAGVLEMNPYRTTVDWQEVALVTFEKAWIRIELPAPMAIDRAGRVTIFEDPGEAREPVTITPQLASVHAMRQQATHFLAAVRGEKTPLCEAPEALEDLRVAERYIELLQGGSR